MGLFQVGSVLTGLFANKNLLHTFATDGCFCILTFSRKSSLASKEGAKVKKLKKADSKEANGKPKCRGLHLCVLHEHRMCRVVHINPLESSAEG